MIRKTPIEIILTIVSLYLIQVRKIIQFEYCFGRVNLFNQKYSAFMTYLNTKRFFEQFLVCVVRLFVLGADLVGRVAGFWIVALSF
jgi:hypothetical protein